MNFFNRAIKNVTRKWSKSVLLILTFFLIGNLVIIGLGVSNASNSAKILTRQKMRAVVTYAIDYNKIMKYVEDITDEDELNKFYENYPRVKLEDIQELLKDSRVKTANAISSNLWYGDSNNTIDFVHLNNQAEENLDTNGQQCYIDESGKEVCENYREPWFFIKCNTFPNMIEFEDGDYQIKSGRFYSQEEIDNGTNVCLISENLATTNALNIGDTITLSISNYNNQIKEMGMQIEELDVQYEIIGIFSHNHPITPDNSNFNYCAPYENPDNVIFMPTKSMYLAQVDLAARQFDYYAERFPEEDYYRDESNRPSPDNMEALTNIDNATLLLNDPLEVDQFVLDHENSISQFTSLDANNEEFNKLSKPLDTLSMYAKFIIWLVVINAIVIITLVTALTLKTREYEIGVLLSIGASKFKIIAQFFIELAIVAIIGFTLSVISGSLIARKIGNTVLEYQISTSGVNEEEDGFTYTYTSPWDNDYSTEITLDDLVAEYDVTVSPLIIAEIYILGLGIVLISVIIPSFMIMRYNPKKILMNQN